MCKGASNLLIKFGKVSSVSLYHISGSSELGYGQYSYIRVVSKEGKIHCCLLLGKMRVAPEKFVSIPRLQLTPATWSVKVASLLKNEVLVKLKRGFEQTTK